MFDTILGRYEPGRDPLRTHTARKLLAALQSCDAHSIKYTLDACAIKAEEYGPQHGPAALFERDPRYIDALGKAIAARDSLEAVAAMLSRIQRYAPALQVYTPGSGRDLALRVALHHAKPMHDRQRPLSAILGEMKKVGFDVTAALELMTQHMERTQTSEPPTISEEWFPTAAPSAPSTDPDKYQSSIPSAKPWPSTIPDNNKQPRLALRSGRSTTTGEFAKDPVNQQQEIATTSELAHQLREYITAGDVMGAKLAFEACVLRAQSQPFMAPEALFANDGHNADILALGLTRCRSWQQFDDMLALALHFAPNLKTLRYERDQQTLVSKYLACAVETYGRMDWPKIITAMKKFSNSGLDTSYADMQIQGTYVGTRFSNYMQSIEQQSERM